LASFYRTFITFKEASRRTGRIRQDGSLLKNGNSVGLEAISY